MCCLQSQQTYNQDSTNLESNHNLVDQQEAPDLWNIYKQKTYKGDQKVWVREGEGGATMYA